MSIRAIARRRGAFTILFACLAALAAPGSAGAATLPAGFQQSTAITGLERPMDVELTPAGQVFVAEKSGIVKSFSSLSDTTPRVAVDLRTQVHNFSARGLMSLAVDPNYATEPYIYVYYTLDAKIGGTPPLYGDPDGTWDSCAKAPLGLDENCIVGGRISRLRIAGEAMTGAEQVLVEDWCQQYPVHTGGGLAFGADGYLYFTAGDGSTATFWDYGQTGTPPNPCGDPPGTIGSLLTPPTAEGGRLRVQDLRTAGDPTGLDGTLIRIDPRTGAGVAGNPLFDSGSENERRILAYGLRDAVRLAIRPGTNDVWVGDRGGGYWEELDRVPDTGSVRNFGWPCYEGGIDAQGDPYTRIRPRSVEENTNICNGLYAAGNETVAPYWAYDHEQPVVSGETCTTDALGAPAGSLLSGMSFYPAAGGSFPAPYRKALFFTDRLRDCIYALLPGSDGLPERGNVVLFASQAMRPIDLEVTTGGDLLYVDQDTYAVHRIRYVGNPANQAPTAIAAADKVSGPAPLTVRLDGTHSTDPDTRDAFAYEWDLDGDGAFDDSTSARPKVTIRRPGTRNVSLRVTDTGGLSDTDTLSIEITEPTTTLTFSPAADARVEEVHPVDNYGTSDKLRAALGPGMESFLRFQLSGISGSVRSAKLTLTAATNGTVDGPGVHSVSGDWSESTLTWATRPGHGADPVSDAGTIASNTKVEYDVKSLVTGDGTLDLALVPTSTDGVELSSKEHLNIAKRPVLEVTFATPFDDQAPTSPADLAAQVASQSRVNLSWTASTDNVGVTSYEIYRNGELLDVVGNVTTYADNTVSVETPYEYTVRALDVEENRSAASNAATVNVPDTENPATPANLAAQAAGAARVDLSWAASADNVGVTNYEIYRDGQLLATVGNVTSYSDTGVGAETPYQYFVRALDARQNRSDSSNTATVTVPDIVKPTAPANLTAQVGGPARVDLSWTASTDNVGVSNYEVYRNGSLRAVVANVTTYADITVNPEVAYQYTVRALDVKQNRSDASNTATVTVPDTVAPTAPGNLAAQAVSGARVNLSWTASTDNVGVSNYEVYRNGALLTVLGNVTTYADMLVSPLTSYEYTVRAVDGKQNRSVASNVANATTLAPTVTVSPVADAHVEEAKKNSNYGTATTLRTVKGAGKNVFESYLRFDVSGVPGTVKSAKLRLFATTATSDGPGVHAAASIWTETAITWSNRPARSVAPVDDKAAIAAGATVEYDVKPLVTGNGTVSFALVSTSAAGVDFASREFAAAAKRPQLIIGY
jgi:glucose/arabinose dehydrogenase/chitodextrinase